MADVSRITLCAFSQAGITKYAYFSTIDEQWLWSGPSFALSGRDLAWRAYWGLKGLGDQYQGDPTHPAGIDKESQPGTFQTYNGGNLACASTRPPVLVLQTDADYYLENDVIGVTWSASDFESLYVTPPLVGPSWISACNNPNLKVFPLKVSGTQVDGSCASATLSSFGGIGQQTVTLTASNGTLPATKQVTVAAAPEIDGISDIGGTGVITTLGTIVIKGRGFSPDGGNSLTFTSPSQIITLNGAYLIAESRSQITALLLGSVPSGIWQVAASSPHGTSQSFPFIILIQ